MRNASKVAMAFWLVLLSLTGLKSGNANDDIELPERFTNTPAGSPLDNNNTPFWHRLGDPMLADLIRTGLAGNFDIASARHRIAQAEAAARQQKAALLPSVSVEAAYNISPYNAVGTGLEIDPIPGMTPDGDTQIRHAVSALLKASYLLDITGRNYVERQAALQDAAAAKADAETAALNLAALIALTYFDVVAAKMRRTVIEEQIETNAALLELMEARLDTGSANALDVLQQRQQLAATTSQLPLAKSAVETGQNQLALLIGATSVDDLPQIPRILPDLSADPAVGTPGHLIDARPDLRAQSARVAAAEQRKKGAFRTLLPSLGLTGQVGYQMNYIDQLDDGEIWGVGLLLSIPIFEGGRNRAVLQQVSAAQSAVENTYRQAALSAVEQVQSALVRFGEQHRFYKAVRSQRDAAQTAFTEAKERYMVGLSDYLNVLVTLGTYQQVQLSVVQARRDLIIHRVHLLAALGGGWTRHLLAQKAR
ncbi:MAG: TolC family protein [Myxococcota bacterium]|nr:TolC family protein [Myxococcota bacterium]